MTAGDFGALERVGLNLQAVFDIAALPEGLRTRLASLADDPDRYRQLILIGNAGPTLWASVKAARLDSTDPIDDFSTRAVDEWFAAHYGNTPSQHLYPGDAPLDLQSLGRLAGWHHASPFKIGINARWGTWFAYRVALLAGTGIAPTPVSQGESPCNRCSAKPCTTACPANAMESGDFDLPRCIAYRRRAGSACAQTCLARISCPVGTRHRYDEEQIRHGYGNSLRMIEWYAAGAIHRG